MDKNHFVAVFVTEFSLITNLFITGIKKFGQEKSVKETERYPRRISGGGGVVKSFQSTLSHLQSPPERMQSQRNYGSFLRK